MVQADLEPIDINWSISPLHAAFRRTWHAFCTTSSIHGLKYAHDRKTHRIVRGIWMLLSLIMFACAIAMVITFYLDFRSNPTRMNVLTDHAPVEGLYFPAVTLCPSSLFNSEKSQRFLEKLKLPPNTTVDEFMNGLIVVYGFMNDEDERNITLVQQLQQLLVLNNISITYFMKQISWNCTDMLIRCRFHWQMVECSTLFQKSRTFFGYCCSFNLNQTSLNFTKRYARPGFQDGLTVMLYHNDSSLDTLSTYSAGWKVLVNEHNSFPSAHSVSKFASLSEETFITMNPIEVFCSRAIELLSAEERQCVFPREYLLKYFTHYVGANCDLNCRASKMVKFCGCVTYFFHNGKVRDRICEFADIPCLVDNFADIAGRFRNTQCVCPTVCEILKYNIEMTSAPLELNAPTVDDFYNGIEKENAVLHIYFNSQVYRRVKRDLLSNMVTLVANLGSAFSLFVGMSMVSVVEIIYYFTVILRKYYLQEHKAREGQLFTKKPAKEHSDKTPAAN